MYRFVSSLILASLWLSPSCSIVRAGQLNTNSPQSQPVEQPSLCEKVRITLNNGHTIETKSYQHQNDQIQFSNKGTLQIIPDKDIKKIEIIQGDCPDILLTLKTGEKIKGYRRDHSCADTHSCKTEIRQGDKLITINDSDIRLTGLKFKKTFGERMKGIVMSPVYAFSYGVLFFVCIKGCKDL
jgi:hypothetical protein